MAPMSYPEKVLRIGELAIQLQLNDTNRIIHQALHGGPQAMTTDPRVANLQQRAAVVIEQCIQRYDGIRQQRQIEQGIDSDVADAGDVGDEDEEGTERYEHQASPLDAEQQLFANVFASNRASSVEIKKSRFDRTKDWVAGLDVDGPTIERGVKLQRINTAQEAIGIRGRNEGDEEYGANMQGTSGKRRATSQSIEDNNCTTPAATRSNKRIDTASPTLAITSSSLQQPTASGKPQNPSKATTAIVAATSSTADLEAVVHRPLNDYELRFAREDAALNEKEVVLLQIGWERLSELKPTPGSMFVEDFPPWFDVPFKFGQCVRQKTYGSKPRKNDILEKSLNYPEPSPHGANSGRGGLGGVFQGERRGEQTLKLRRR